MTKTPSIGASGVTPDSDMGAILEWLVKEGRLTAHPDGSSYVLRRETFAAFDADSIFVQKLDTAGAGTDFGIFAKPLAVSISKELVLVTTFTIGEGVPVEKDGS